MVVDFKAWHLLALDPRGLRPDQLESVTVENAEFFASYGGWYTYMVGGRPIACWGLIRNDKGLWLSSYLVRDTSKHMLALHRVAMAVLRSVSEPVLAATREDFPAGCRWLKMLGFRPVCPLSDLYPEVTGAILYER
jgi:hypothetical protein